MQKLFISCCQKKLRTQSKNSLNRNMSTLSQRLHKSKVRFSYRSHVYQLWAPFFSPAFLAIVFSNSSMTKTVRKAVR